MYTTKEKSSGNALADLFAALGRGEEILSDAWLEITRREYVVDQTEVACVLYQQRTPTHRGETCAVLVMQNANCRCAVAHLSLETGWRLCQLLSENRVSPVHAWDVLEDAALDALGRRFLSCD